MTRACIFCGNTPVTKEHVWPDQLEALFPEMTGVVAQYSMGDADQPVTQKTWTSEPFAQRVKVTCHDCNHGWLNDLENAAMPWLRPMVRPGGVGVQLRRSAQTAIAAYFLRVVTLAQYLAGNAAFLPSSSIEALRDKHTPSANEQVWVARYSGEDVAPKLTARPLIVDTPETPRDRPNAYAATMRIGNLAVQLFGHDGQYPARFRSALPQALLQIWPTSQAVYWPPQAAFNDVGYLGLVRQFNHPRRHR